MFVAWAALSMLTFQQEPKLTPGIVITKSTDFDKVELLAPNGSADGKTAAITIRGNNITVDFGGATLRGSNDTTEPNLRAGTGVRIEGNNITVINLKVRGYKIGVIADGTKNLKLHGVDASYNWKQRLLSGLDKEDLSDWMSFHKNEAGEWLKFGAGIYLKDSESFEVVDCTAVGGQCGLMITNSNRGKIWNNNFSFLSAIGLGMYRSSDNVVMHNNIDWCVRGYSHGVYNRGQDSAGILIYEQSNRNVFAYNSVTHGGDGFFLWAGQSTMDTGEGGCNDNVLWGNDFSHAPTNGIEATFSRNQFVNNLMLECWHGIWGGYSYDSLIHSNYFGLNAEGIALEHGQNNKIVNNSFDRNRMGIYLWQNKSQDPNWVYPKKRDTRAKDQLIEGNEFVNTVESAIRLRDTLNTSVIENEFARNGNVLLSEGENAGLKFQSNKIASSVELGALTSGNAVKVDPKSVPQPATILGSGNIILGLDPETADYLARFNVKWQAFPGPAVELDGNRLPPPAMLDGGNVPFLAKGKLRGRRYILVDEWGPYDFRSPKLWPRSKESKLGGEIWTFEVLGPQGSYTVKSVSGGEVVGSRSGSVPGTLQFRAAPGTGNLLDIQLEYKGARTVDYRGVATPAGATVPFGFSKFNLPIAWTVSWFNYDFSKMDPREKQTEFKRLLAGPPTAEAKMNELNLAWGGSPARKVNNDYFGTLAVGNLEISPGDYVLNVTSDDGVRVWVDGKLVIDNWTYHAPTLDSATLKLGGKHQIRVEHFELNGYSTLKVEIVPKK